MLTRKLCGMMILLVGVMLAGVSALTLIGCDTGNGPTDGNGGNGGNGGNNGNGESVSFTAIGNGGFQGQQVCGLAFGNGRFATIVNGLHDFGSSDDGITWTKAADIYDDPLFAAPNDNWFHWRSIDFANNRFYLGAECGVLIETANGHSDWSIVENHFFDPNGRNKAGNLDIDNVSYANGTLFLTGHGPMINDGGGNSHYDGKISYNSGAGWQQASVPLIFPGDTAGITGIAYGNGIYVAVGDQTALMATSSNGVTWTELPTANNPFIYYEEETFSNWKRPIYDIIFAEGKFVAVGGGGIIAYSTNGTEWTRAANPIATTNRAIRCITYGAGKFLVGGLYGKAAYSEDGITWTAIGNTTFSDNSSSNIITAVYGEGKFIIGGELNGNPHLAYWNVGN